MIILFYLALTIAFIITSTAKYKIHPFLVLIFASLIMGFMGGLEPNVILKTLSEGFGNTLKSIGIIIAGGSIIGVFLEKTRAAQSIAEKIVKKIAKKTYLKDGIAVNLTISAGMSGFPVHSDSIRDLIGKADKAMYQTKLKGGNGVSIAE